MRRVADDERLGHEKVVRRDRIARLAARQNVEKENEGKRDVSNEEEEKRRHEATRREKRSRLAATANGRGEEESVETRLNSRIEKKLRKNYIRSLRLIISAYSTFL